MIACMNLLHKEQLYDQGQPGMNTVKKVINFLELGELSKKEKLHKKTKHRK